MRDQLAQLTSEMREVLTRTEEKQALLELAEKRRLEVESLLESAQNSTSSEVNNLLEQIEELK